jgi:hypothetical protein
MEEKEPEQTAYQICRPASVKSLDVISKSLAAAAIVVYACGFLITSIYDSGYGFIETNFFRP